MRRVGIAVFDRMRVFEYAVATEVWGLDRTGRGVPPFELRVCAPGQAAVAMSPRTQCLPDHDLDGLAACDLVIVPGVEDPGAVFPREALDALRAAHRRGARIASLCSGAFVLAAAGLLDGRTATAHWQDAADLARRHPAVTVDPNVLFVGDGTVWTSAGTAAGIDLCLHLVRCDHGAAVAAEIARTMVTAPFRPGGQAQYIPMPVAGTRDPGEELAALRERVLSDVGRPWTVAAMASQAGMSERHFTRRFGQATGTTPLQWLLAQRVLAAQRLLETSGLSVAAIARRCGFGTALTFRQHFTRQVGVTPSGYRRTFAAELREGAPSSAS